MQRIEDVALFIVMAAFHGSAIAIPSPSEITILVNLRRLIILPEDSTNAQKLASKLLANFLGAGRN